MIKQVTYTMPLEGWTIPLPDWIVKAIQEGKITVNQEKGYQFLLGQVFNPEGTLIIFL